MMRDPKELRVFRCAPVEVFAEAGLVPDLPRAHGLRALSRMLYGITSRPVRSARAVAVHCGSQERRPVFARAVRSQRRPVCGARRVARGAVDVRERPDALACQLSDDRVGSIPVELPPARFELGPNEPRVDPSKVTATHAAEILRART